ncbi:MAG: Ig-like domain-containing protein, partial [Pseudomonadota bacterium]|nr:Ig-like domain-containing protein [Pseudomonadota bacterium]
SLLIDGKPPVVKNVSPRDGETVITNPVLISATFDDAGGVGIDTRSVRVLVGGNDVTRSAGVTPQFFSYRADLKPGSYAVEVTARDVAGKSLRHTWSFIVASAAAPVPTALPLQITSHANNAQVGSGPIEVKGRTGPDAKVDVQVQAIASIAGFFGLTQQIYTQTLKADANGNFSFSFQPQVTVPGTRYEVSINASKGDLTKDTKLVLFQQK